MQKADKGVVLAQTLVIITILTIVAGAFLVLSQGDLLLSRKSEDELTEFYIEQAAIEKALATYYESGSAETKLVSVTIDSYNVSLSWDTDTVTADVQ